MRTRYVRNTSRRPQHCHTGTGLQVAMTPANASGFGAYRRRNCHSKYSISEGVVILGLGSGLSTNLTG